MLIRSSDGIHIVNLNHIDGVSVCLINGEITVRSFSPVDESGLRLGTYDSKERALKVLDEICNSYQYCNECTATGIGAAQPEFIYYMPED